MTFRTRLTIAFLVIVLIPIILFGATIAVMTSYESHMIRKEFGIDVDTLGIATNGVQLFASSTDNIYGELRETANERSTELEDPAFLEVINGRLEKLSSFLVIRKGNDIYYSGDAAKTTEIRELLPQ